MFERATNDFSLGGNGVGVTHMGTMQRNIPARQSQGPPAASTLHRHRACLGPVPKGNFIAGKNTRQSQDPRLKVANQTPSLCALHQLVVLAFLHPVLMINYSFAREF